MKFRCTEKRDRDSGLELICKDFIKMTNSEWQVTND